MQALESEAVMIRFHSVYEKISQALDGMPYAEVGISEEVKEQVGGFLPDCSDSRHLVFVELLIF